MAINPITIDVLEMIDAIDRRGSFASAAEDLERASSALSYGIQKLEEQLGVTVFQRQGRRSVLTPAGRIILEEGRKILNTTALLANKAKEVASGWEPKLRIAVESSFNYPLFFQVMADFLNDHASIEIDISECVLNGGWEALEQDRVELIVGVPGPVPAQKGYRALAIPATELVPVVASGHPLAALAKDSESLAAALPSVRRIVTHDTSRINIAASAGFSMGKQFLYVQTIGQKIDALVAGLGVGHVPRRAIEVHLNSGVLVELKLDARNSDYFIARKTSNKGKALQTLYKRLAEVSW